MINFLKAKETFERYVNNFDKTNPKVYRKIEHTYCVVEASQYLAKQLGLSEEDTELSKLIALLHDIGRFKQSEINCKTYDEAELGFNHAEYGVKILFEDNLIRDFIEDSKYDNIILEAIRNHNKVQISNELSEKELLHARLIRDNDKTGNFTFKCKANYEMDNKSISENEEISDDVYKEFMDKKTISIINRKTQLDKWISLIAFIFDYNFKEAIKYIYENKYIDMIFEKMSHNKNSITIARINDMRIIANNYIQEKLKR